MELEKILNELPKPDIIVAKPIPFGNYYLFPKHYIEYKVEPIEELYTIQISNTSRIYAETLDDLDKELHETLIFLWEVYAKDDDEYLMSEDSKTVKYYMLANFMEIKQ